MAEDSLAGRVAVVTGAGAGIGRAEALALADRGADLVLTDVGSLDATADLARTKGARVSVVPGDIRDWALGARLVAAALDLGSLDIVVNNAGIVRDAMIFSISEQQWDDVIDVHLKGHAALTRAVTAHWRELAKAGTGRVYGRIVNTASEAALTGSPGQPNYAAAKAGIVALTVATARATGKYGVTANAICPRARTGMTAGVLDAPPQEGFDALGPEHVASFVGFLASPQAAHITGRTFVVYGRAVGLVAEPALERTVIASGTELSDRELAAGFASLDDGSSGILEQLRDFQSAAGTV